MPRLDKARRRDVQRNKRKLYRVHSGFEAQFNAIRKRTEALNRRAEVRFKEGQVA